MISESIVIISFLIILIIILIKINGKKSNNDILEETGWNQNILLSLTNGFPKTPEQIKRSIQNNQNNVPWDIHSVTPTATCSSICGTLYKRGILDRDESTKPYKYFIPN